MLRRRFLVLPALRWFQVGLQVPVLILLLQARGLDLTSVGVVFAVYGLMTALFELPTGGLADVLGRRHVLIAATVVELLAPASFARLLGGETEAAGHYAVLLTAGFFGSAAGSSQAVVAVRLLQSPSRAIMAARLLGAFALLSVATSSFAVAAVALVGFYALNGIASARRGDPRTLSPATSAARLVHSLLKPNTARFGDWRWGASWSRSWSWSSTSASSTWRSAR
jgi:MFS family permease